MDRQKGRVVGLGGERRCGQRTIGGIKNARIDAFAGALTGRIRSDEHPEFLRGRGRRQDDQTNQKR